MTNSKLFHSVKLKNKTTFNKWVRVAKRNNLKINQIKVIGELNRNNDDFCISTIDGVFVKDNRKVSRVIQLEGDSVVIIPILIVGKNKKIKTIVVRQFRAPVCKKTIEFPSGNVKSKRYKKQAVKEIQEEIGIKIKSNQLIRLNKNPIFMLPANNFTRVVYYTFILKTNNAFIKKINNSKFGCEKEGEFITTKVMNLNQLKNSTSASVLIGLELLKKSTQFYKNA